MLNIDLPKTISCRKKNQKGRNNLKFPHHKVEITLFYVNNVIMTL